jgi:hypothetical protein
MSTSIKIEKSNNSASKQATIDSIKNLTRLETLSMTECGKRCFSNYKTDKISSDENLCLTNCYSKFYDSLEVGSKLFDLYSSKEYNLTSIMKGQYDEITKGLKDKL